MLNHKEIRITSVQSLNLQNYHHDFGKILLRQAKKTAPKKGKVIFLPSSKKLRAMLGIRNIFNV